MDQNFSFLVFLFHFFFIFYFIFVFFFFWACWLGHWAGTLDMGIPWAPQGGPWGPMGTPWGSHGHPMGAHGGPWGPHWDPMGDPMGCLGYFSDSLGILRSLKKIPKPPLGPHGYPKTTQNLPKSSQKHSRDTQRQK